MDLNFGVTSIETQCSTEFRTSLFVGMLQFEDQIIRELDRNVIQIFMSNRHISEMAL